MRSPRSCRSPDTSFRLRPARGARSSNGARPANYALLVDFVRSVGPPGRATLLSLLAASDPALAKRAPRLGSFDARPDRANAAARRDRRAPHRGRAHRRGTRPSGFQPGCGVVEKGLRARSWPRLRPAEARCKAGTQNAEHDAGDRQTLTARSVRLDPRQRDDPQSDRDHAQRQAETAERNKGRRHRDRAKPAPSARFARRPALLPCTASGFTPGGRPTP